jgi:hypothetical protein
LAVVRAVKSRKMDEGEGEGEGEGEDGKIHDGRRRRERIFINFEADD